MRWPLLGALLLGLMVSLPATGAGAERVEDTVSLASGENVVVEIEVEDGMDIRYHVQVESGPKVNVWFMDGGDLFLYSRGLEFTYYMFYSHERVETAEEDFYWSDEGTYYVVIDTKGTASPASVATVSYTVEWEEPTISSAVWAAVCLVVVMVGVITILFLRNVRQKRAMSAPPPRMPPPDPLNVYEMVPPAHRKPLAPSDRGPGHVPRETGYERRGQGGRGGPPT